MKFSVLVALSIPLTGCQHVPTSSASPTASVDADHVKASVKAAEHSEGPLAELPHPELYQFRATSPDGKLAVSVPILRFHEETFEDVEPINALVELGSLRVLATLPCGWVGWSKQNHGGCGGEWSKDGGILCWKVHGKWTSDSIVIVKISDGQVAWKLNTSKLCQRHILDCTQAAQPDAYARARFQNKGFGAAYPEGFTIDVRPGIDPALGLSWPLKIQVDLTSDPKGPRKDMVESWLDATLQADGKLSFGKFHLGPRPDDQNTGSKPFGG